MIKHVIVDVDEVLLDWLAGFSDYLQRVHNIKVNGSPTAFDLSLWLNKPSTDVATMVLDFNQNDPLFGQLKPLSDSSKYLPMLYNDGYKITALSACSSNRTTFTNRQYNLLSIYGEIFDKIILVDDRIEKYEWLKKLPQSIVIEDNVETAQKAADYGHTVFVYRQDYNKNNELHNPHIIWVNDWKTIWDQLHNPSDPND